MSVFIKILINLKKDQFTNQLISKALIPLEVMRKLFRGGEWVYLRGGFSRCQSDPSISVLNAFPPMVWKMMAREDVWMTLQFRKQLISNGLTPLEVIRKLFRGGEWVYLRRDFSRYQSDPTICVLNAFPPLKKKKTIALDLPVLRDCSVLYSLVQLNTPIHLDIQINDLWTCTVTYPLTIYFFRRVSILFIEIFFGRFIDK